MQFENNGSINFTVNPDVRAARRAVRNPDRHRDPGRRLRLSAVTRPASTPERSGRSTATGSYTWGEFWNGHTKSLTRHWAAAQLPLRASISTTARNDVTLANGAFTTDLVGARFLYAFTPRAIFNAFLQYNADTHQVSSNIRFNLTHHPLSDLYLVYNDTETPESDNPSAARSSSR